MKLPVWGKLVRGAASDPSKPGMARQALIHWLKFNVVGGIGIGVQLAALAILRSLLQLDYLLATVLAVETAVLHNFIWHARFTWADRPASGLTDSLIRFMRFNATNGLVSILGNLLLMPVAGWHTANELLRCQCRRDCGLLAGQLPSERLFCVSARTQNMTTSNQS